MHPGPDPGRVQMMFVSNLCWYSLKHNLDRVELSLWFLGLGLVPECEFRKVFQQASVDPLYSSCCSSLLWTEKRRNLLVFQTKG